MEEENRQEYVLPGDDDGGEDVQLRKRLMCSRDVRVLLKDCSGSRRPAADSGTLRAHGGHFQPQKVEVVQAHFSRNVSGVHFSSHPYAAHPSR